MAAEGTQKKEENLIKGKQDSPLIKNDATLKDQKITISVGSKRLSSENETDNKKKPAGFTLKGKEKEEKPVLQKKAKLAAVFNDDSESDEEMPLECRMKMRNIGRGYRTRSVARNGETATSAGPKSFNKGKQGFSKNSFKQFELSMKPRNSMEKQTDFGNDT